VTTDELNPSKYVRLLRYARIL